MHGAKKVKNKEARCWWGANPGHVTGENTHQSPLCYKPITTQSLFISVEFKINIK